MKLIISIFILSLLWINADAKTSKAKIAQSVHQANLHKKITVKIKVGKRIVNNAAKIREAKRIPTAVLPSSYIQTQVEPAGASMQLIPDEIIESDALVNELLNGDLLNGEGLELEEALNAI